jgi:hypothetical protein
MAERITKYHPIGLEEFQSILANNFKIRNVYVKNIMFACSLLTSTSTWHSDYHNRPGGYMSRELKSEIIKYQTAPTQRSHYPTTRPTIIPSYITKPRKIFVHYTRPFYNTRKTLKTTKTIQPRPSLINKTLTDCCLYLNAITTDDLEHSLR